VAVSQVGLIAWEDAGFRELVRQGRDHGVHSVENSVRGRAEIAAWPGAISVGRGATTSAAFDCAPAGRLNAADFPDCAVQRRGRRGIRHLRPRWVRRL
jgi:hypothetical protein